MGEPPPGEWRAHSLGHEVIIKPVSGNCVCLGEVLEWNELHSTD